MIRLLTLGGLALVREHEDEAGAAPVSAKRLALLAYLSVEGLHGALRRDSLLALFWPESDERRARDALSQILRSIRRDLGREVLSVSAASGVALSEARVTCDAVELLEATARAEHERALSLYRGDYLDGFHLGGSVGFEEWVSAWRTRLREKTVASGKALAELRMREGAPEAAVATLKRVLEIEPFDEGSLRTLIRLHLDAGEHGLAVAAYDEHVARLQRELDASPAAETVALIERARVPVVVRDRPQAIMIESAGPAGRDGSASEGASPGSLPNGSEKRRAASGGAPPRDWRIPWRWPVLVGLGALVGATALSAWAGRRSTPPPTGIVRFSIAPQGRARIALGTNHRNVAISPDGRTIAYTAADPQGLGLQISLRALDEPEARPMTGGEGGFEPFFSADGAWVGFRLEGAFGDLRRARTTGGSPVRVTVSPNPVFGASWAPDDWIVFGTGRNESQGTGRGLFRVRAGGGEPQQLTTIDRAGGEVFHLWPDHVEGRNAVIFVIAGPDPLVDPQLAVLDLASGAVHRLGLGGTSPSYLPTGHLVYANMDGTLYGVRFDAGSLEARGSPVVMLEDLQVKPSGGANYAISDDGRLIYVERSPPPEPAPRELVWVDRRGDAQALPLPPGPYAYPRLSPDGRRIAVSIVRNATRDLWVYEIATGAGLRLTRDDYRNSLPIWTPDGQRLLFSSTRDAPQPDSATFFWWGNVYSIAADGSGPAERLTASHENHAPTAISPDGSVMLYSVGAPLGGLHWSVRTLPLDGRAGPTPLLVGPFRHGAASVSPNGRWLAYRSDESGAIEVYVQPYPGPGPKVPVSIGGGTAPVWSRDGRELFYLARDGTMTAAAITGDVEPEVGLRTPLFSALGYGLGIESPVSYDLAPDGRFLMLRRAPAEDPPRDPPAPEIHVVLNWIEELRARVPN